MKKGAPSLKLVHLEEPGVRPRSDGPPPLPLSSHNWNTLFMGSNAVADAIAQKYSATKSQVFDHVSGPPVGCTPALGQAQGAKGSEGASSGPWHIPAALQPWRLRGCVEPP